MPLIGLTGGYASGKSLALSAFRELGAYVIDCDQLAREAVAPGAEGLERVIEAFGPGVLNEEGGLDREKMAALVFADESSRKKLEGILHPIIIRRVYETAADILAGGKNRIVVVDAPLLYEAGMEKGMDVVVAVVCGEEEQIRRGMARDKISRQQALARIRAQAPLAEKAAKADYIIDNSGGAESAVKEAASLWEKIRGY